MALEIERKYLVTDDSYKEMQSGERVITQGYLNCDPRSTVRVRTADDKGYITVKGMTCGHSRLEYEYEIPHSDAIEMLELCQGRTLRKVRHIVPYKGHVWEVDEFLGRHSPLVVAEIELRHADEEYEKPPFVGKEVSDDPAYYNSNLCLASVAGEC